MSKKKVTWADDTKKTSSKSKSTSTSTSTSTTTNTNTSTSTNTSTTTSKGSTSKGSTSKGSTSKGIGPMGNILRNTNRGGGGGARGNVLASTSKRDGVTATSSTSKDVVATIMTKEQEAALSFWSRDLDLHHLGNFSMAVIQANKTLEDYSQIEVGWKSTFVGIYDGHGGTLTAEHVCNNLTRHLMEYVRETGTMSKDSLTQAFLRTESTWLEYVRAQFDANPVLVSNCGSCCLVGVFWKKNLYVANVGDSRAIIGREVKGYPKIVFEQLTRDDNVKDPVVRAEVQALYPDDPDIVIKKHQALRIKGKLQVSKSIGDVCLKIPRFNLDRFEGHKLNKPVRAGIPAVTALPIPTMTRLGAQDRFVIFASDGLWDQLSNQEAADIVHENPKEGIAARLIRAALVKAAKKTNKSYDDILKVRVESGIRRNLYYDDITVAVLFFNQGMQGSDKYTYFPRISVKGGKNMAAHEISKFTALDELKID